MGVDGQMDPLDFLTNENLLLFLHRKKTEISCMEQPHTFLTQLRDHDLLPDKLYKKLKGMRSREQRQKGVYDFLDWLEKEKSHRMHRFWGCVFKDHILHLYPTLRLLRNSLLDGTFSFYEKPTVEEGLTEKEQTEGKGEKVKETKNYRKQKIYDKASEDSDGPGPSSASTPTRKKPAKKPSFSSPIKKGDTQEIWKWPLYKTQLPVSCGNKEGTLHRDRLARGEKCIYAQGRWFTPSAFEQYGGKERCKNWTLAIRCRNTPLKKLIEEGHLQAPPMERRNRTCVQKSTRELFPVSSSDSSGADSDTSALMEEERDEDEFEEQRRREGETEFSVREEEVEEEADMEDLSVFLDPSLPVTCVSISGMLHKYRFASDVRGKCIRTDESWFTPEEFVRQEPSLTDGFWKRDILCHGKTLNFLLKKDILWIHSLLCECEMCSDQEQDLLAQKNDDTCYTCDSKRDIVCCDGCPRAFHPDCHLPALQGDSSGEWMCTFCVLRANQQWLYSSHMTEQDALNVPVSQNKLHCHYLLLYMYREDVHRVFVKDPCRTVAKYSQIIPQPMWLDRIKEKLEHGEYQTVGEFVSDFQLIFSNCSRFNKDNEFGRMGVKLKELFEKEFQNIFSIQ
ncbi:nuclear body protein SP140-like protein [Xyrauchen texanus]|uniref:nuclear body protein SP140-like protein n=1 Tax=Xyrauchen texanus TaxID=154827 RepID=UPI0022429AA8|nr:nuclear body protein SP140-like protein [Xyrauchen texanus]XP_051989130.1 nuclear body protein SP140-like protein [Xyrauchen texanus]